MKITIKSSDFRTGIARVADSTNAATDLPILSNLLLEAGDGHLVLTGTNLSQSAKVQLDCEVVDPGIITLPCKTLADVVGALNGDTATLEIVGTVGTIRSGKSVFQIAGLPATDYPDQLFPQSGQVGEWHFKADMLKRVFVQLSPVQSTDPARHYLMGILMKSREKSLDWVATNGRALSIVETQNDGPEVDTILPSDFVRQSIRAMDYEDSVTISLFENCVKLIGKTGSIVSKLVEGNFPSYKTFTPENYKSAVELPREEFLKMIARLTKVGLDQNKQSIVTLIGTKNNLEIIANKGATNCSREEMDVKLETPLTVKLNRQYIDAVLRNALEDTVRMEYSDGFSPIVFKTPSCTSVLQVIRIKDDQ